MSTAPEPRPREPKPALVFDDPLDQQSADDTDRGWGGFSSRKRFRSDALSPDGRSPHPRSV
uniref:hypothetical protein n=1 Tax=Streptomyces prasinopilosus TaxID=67344 RepID=UPI0006EBC08D